jgi:hypothetical protein
MRSLLSLVLYPKHAHSASQMLPADYWGPRQHTPLEQAYNHNLDSVTLNYPCPVSRLRIVSHNRTMRRVAGPMSRIILCLLYPCRFAYTSLRSRMKTGPPQRSQGVHHRCFLALMVGAPGFSCRTSQGGPPLTFLALMVGSPGFSVSTSQEAIHRCF